MSVDLNTIFDLLPKNTCAMIVIKQQGFYPMFPGIMTIMNYMAVLSHFSPRATKW